MTEVDRATSSNVTVPADEPNERVVELVSALRADGDTVAAAESLTGGRVVAALTAIPGASAVVRGAVIAYAADLKIQLLGVDEATLRTQGPVCVAVAAQMARVVRDLLDATYGVATTGEAGPDSASGRPVGTVVVAVAGPQGTTTRELTLAGTRAQVRSGAVDAALLLLSEVRSARTESSGTAGRGGPGNIRD